MTLDPRLLVQLDKVPGFDPVELRVRLASFPHYHPRVVAYHRDRHVVDLAEPEGYFADCRVLLDMADTETRRRACLRLAALVDLPVGEDAPNWRWHPVLGCWLLGHGTPATCRAFHHDGRNIEHEIPTLAGLDPGDDTLLPDASILVDALALALTLVHLGSQP